MCALVAGSGRDEERVSATHTSTRITAECMRIGGTEREGGWMDGRVWIWRWSVPGAL